MNDIKINHHPSKFSLKKHRVEKWSTWSKEISVFPWYFDEQETIYMVEGEVIVTPDGGTPVTITKGDFAIFPEGMSCVWDVRKPVLKHYQLKSSFARETVRKIRMWLTLPEMSIGKFTIPKLAIITMMIALVTGFAGLELLD
jgi:uncharacterized cupin superfamily protein